MQANRTAAVDALLEASRSLVAVSARSVAGTRTQVTLPQFRMLVVLADAERRLVDLAHALDVVPSTAARMVDRLVSAGLVDRRTPEENRRETRLSLTPKGHRMVTTVTGRRRRDLETAVAQLSDRQVTELARAMRTFAGVTEELWT